MWYPPFNTGAGYAMGIRSGAEMTTFEMRFIAVSYTHLDVYKRQTGTSWGTFGILIPIVVNIFSGTNHTMMIISISACMAGAVCGDHCSPISDTTIMASAGAQCNHMNHVSTQLPYAVLVAGISCLTYIITGFVRNPVVPFIIGVLILIGTFVGIKYIIKYITRTDKANEQAE